MSESLDYNTMIFQLLMGTKYTEEYLLSLSDKELDKLHREKLNHGENRK